MVKDMAKKVKKRKIRASAFIILFFVLVMIITFSIIGVNAYKYYTSYEYKLGKVGYNKEEIAKITKFDKKYINYALKKYDKYLIPLVSQKYFLYKNYDRYISYIKKSYKYKKIVYSDVVTFVNTRNDSSFYKDTVVTNMDLGYGILVNKHYSLPEKYAPDDVVTMSNQYAYPNNSIRKDVYEAFKEMSKEAKEEGITLIVNSSYRTYEEQKELYDDYSDKKGIEYADKYAARPDFSEHQTGLALDIFSPGYGMKNFEESKAFAWLSENSWKYGFILRYPKDKDSITGYAYEAWHYRYLGKDLAKKVYESGLTFEEYYSYYLEK